MNDENKDEELPDKGKKHVEEVQASQIDQDQHPQEEPAIVDQPTNVYQQPPPMDQDLTPEEKAVNTMDQPVHPEDQNQTHQEDKSTNVDPSVSLYEKPLPITDKPANALIQRNPYNYPKPPTNILFKPAFLFKPGTVDLRPSQEPNPVPSDKISSSSDPEPSSSNNHPPAKVDQPQQLEQAEHVDQPDPVEELLHVVDLDIILDHQISQAVPAEELPLDVQLVQVDQNKTSRALQIIMDMVEESVGKVDEQPEASTSGVTDQATVDSDDEPSSMIELADTHLQCPICIEVFIMATSTNCGHTFCQDCIVDWRKKNKLCPVCRTRIKHVASSTALDQFITEMFGLMDQEGLQRRREFVKERGQKRGHCGKKK